VFSRFAANVANMEMILRVLLRQGTSYNRMKFCDIASDLIVLKYAFQIIATHCC